MDWISYIRNDEDQALRDIYTHHRKTCISWLKSTYSISEDDSKEIFQSSVIQVYDNVMTGKLDKLTSGIKSYLFSVAKNKAREFLRKSGKQINHDRFRSIYNENGIEEKKVLESKIKVVEDILYSMGDPCKSILQLFYYKRYSMTEVGIKLGYKNSDTVKNQKYKCLKRLQKLLKNHINIEDQYEA